VGYADYTRGDEGSLPINDNDLETPYSEEEVTNVSSSNDVRVAQSATAQYAIHQFKEFADVTAENNKCFVEWEGQTDLDPATSPVYLQIYNQVSPGWETIAQDPQLYGASTVSYASDKRDYNNSAVNVDFKFNVSIPDLTNYKDIRGVVSFRIYQLDI
jgi:hypothetical protein